MNRSGVFSQDYKPKRSDAVHHLPLFVQQWSLRLEDRNPGVRITYPPLEPQAYAEQKTSNTAEPRAARELMHDELLDCDYLFLFRQGVIPTQNLIQRVRAEMEGLDTLVVDAAGFALCQVRRPSSGVDDVSNGRFAWNEDFRAEEPARVAFSVKGQEQTSQSLIKVSPSELWSWHAGGHSNGREIHGWIQEDDEFFATHASLQRIEAIVVDWTGLTASQALLPLDTLRRGTFPLAAVIRASESEVNPSASPADEYVGADVDVVAVTTERLASVRQLVISVRRHLGPDVGVTVVVQAPPNRRWASIARKFDVRMIHVPIDTGLSESRNIGVRQTTRPLVFLMDDDFQLDERCRFLGALSILNTHPEIDILAGNLLDVHHWRDARDKEVSQGYAMKLIEGPPHVRWVRLEDSPRRRNFVNAVDYFEYCDIVDNFALIRREAVFDKGVVWNPVLKIGAEHQDFYLQLFANTECHVARTNTLKVRNVRVQNRKFRALRRRTNVFFSIFFEERNIESFEIVGERTRVRVPGSGHAYFQRGMGVPKFVASSSGEQSLISGPEA